MNAVLVLRDGSVFHGISMGVSGHVCGEIVFNTAMTGYQEILTDPSYASQVILLTSPHIGNVGINKEDAESDRIWANAVIVRRVSSIASNWRSEQTFLNYIKYHNIIGISDIDTRFLVQKIRNEGSFVGCIITDNFDISEAYSYINSSEKINRKNIVSMVSTKHMYHWVPKGHQQDIRSSETYNVIVYDLGVKKNILKCLFELGCKITIVPFDTRIKKILELSPDGIIFSNGPGDPMDCVEIIETLKILLNKEIPLFGICLGHQLLALAAGAKTIKMKLGHHGGNHPVKDLKTGSVLITTQNHGFTIKENTLPSCFYVTHRSLFDGSIQGFRHIMKPIYGFQGHPEGSPGPFDGRCIFNDFISDMNTYKKNLKYHNKLHFEQSNVCGMSSYE